MSKGSDGVRRCPGASMARGLHFGLLAAVLSVLNGCQQLPIVHEQSRQQPPTETQLDEPPGQVRGREVATLLDFYRGVEMAPRAILEERARYLAERVQEGKCDSWRLKYAMIKKALAPPAEIPESRELLTVCLTAKPRSNGALGEFAYLLEELWEAEAVSMQYRNQLQQTRRALENERGETAKLRKQLEGLKAIEQSIQQRDRDRGASGSQ